MKQFGSWYGKFCNPLEKEQKIKHTKIHTFLHFTIYIFFGGGFSFEKMFFFRLSIVFHLFESNTTNNLCKKTVSVGEKSGKTFWNTNNPLLKKQKHFMKKSEKLFFQFIFNFVFFFRQCQRNPWQVLFLCWNCKNEESL